MLTDDSIGDPDRVPKESIFPPVAGVMILDVPFWYDRRKPVRQKTIRSYYGSDAEETWGVSFPITKKLTFELIRTTAEISFGFI